MSNYAKGQGAKIAIRFNHDLIGDVTGLTPTPVGGIAEFQIPPSTLIKIVTVSNSYSANTVNKLFDGSLSTYWETRAILPQSFSVDLGRENEHSIFKFRWYAGSSYRPRAFQLQGSNDNIEWTTILTAESDNTTGWKEWTFDNPAFYRYYRCVVTSLWTAGRVYVYEVELFARKEVGNEQAFTIEGQEHLHVKGELISGDYQVKKVEPYPDSSNAILLTMKPLNRFRNVEGNLTIKYDQSKGNLAGIGGVVEGFERAFSPNDLIQVPNPLNDENITLGIVNYDLNMIKIDHTLVGDSTPNVPNIMIKNNYPDNENIALGITNYQILLINIGDIDP